MRKLRSVQILRGLAAVGVVVCHSTEFPLGAAGVDVFFVISGFIMSRVMVGRTASEFATDRLWRIYPIYWLMAAPWLAAAAAAGILPLNRIVSTITLWPIVGGYARPVLIPAWTLCYEMLFYAAITVGIATRKWRLLIFAYALAFAGGFLVKSALLAFIGNPLVIEFLMGVVIARAPRNRSVAICGLVPAAFALVFAESTLFYDLPVDTSGIQALARLAWWGLPAAAIVYAGLAFEDRIGRWSSPLVYLGDASYSIYLAHVTVIAAIGNLSPTLKVVVAVGVGIVIHETLEKRLLSLRQHRPRSTDSLAAQTQS